MSDLTSDNAETLFTSVEQMLCQLLKQALGPGVFDKDQHGMTRAQFPFDIGNFTDRFSLDARLKITFEFILI
jgi:hypothetical protein